MPSPTSPDTPCDAPCPSNRLPVNALTLSPTDISQYLSLNRCERFLRLRLHERNKGRDFLRAFGVTAQAITPMLSRSGADFETVVAARLAARFGAECITDFAAAPLTATGSGKRLRDNGRVVEVAQRLLPGERRVVCQPRMEIALGAWQIRGDADLLLFERDADSGALSVLITDTKSSTKVTVEHRLQVAFYQAMVARLFADAAIRDVRVGTAILYRGPTNPDLNGDARLAADRTSSVDLFGADEAFLEVVADTDAYLAEVETLVTGAKSDALRIATAPFDDLFFSLALKCDGCLYNEFCMKDAHARADVALVPFLTPRDKKALVSAGIATIPQLARLKEFTSTESFDLLSRPATEATVRRLAATTAGPRLDELILRARATRLVGAPRTNEAQTSEAQADASPTGEPAIRSLSYLPSKGHTTLPFSGPEHNPNLIRIYIDAQHDYLHDRIYLLGALVVANEGGIPAGRRHVVHLTPGPPDTAQKEADLFAVWIHETMTAVAELAAPDAAGERKAPIHLIFWNDFGQRLLLDALARNMTPMVEAAPALYDFVTQIAAFDSPVATFLDAEIREHKNYPMFCQSLQAISQFLKFPWNETEIGGDDWRKRFHERLFDKGGRAEFVRDGITAEEFYERRSRHNSQVPLEYAYAAWNELDAPASPDLFAAYRATTPDDLTGLQARRLDAVAHIADTFRGNHLTEKTAFTLPDLAAFRERAPHLAGALVEFNAIERHVALSAWKTARQMPPERRVLVGETLLARYVEADQEAGVAEQNVENARRKIIKDQFYAEYRAANPSAKQVRLTAEQKAECAWAMADMPFRLRVDLTGIDADLETVLGLLNLKEGDRYVLYPRWSVDERLPEAERTPNTPTPKQMLYGMRAELTRFTVHKDGAGRAVEAFADVIICSPGGASGGYLFGAIDRPLEANALYTLDPDPNDIYGLWQSKVSDGLNALEAGGTPDLHALYHRIAYPGSTCPVKLSLPDAASDAWPVAAAEGQARFLLGLDAFRDAGMLHDFETGKRAYIGEHGGDPILLVQGPPGTGKSYSTAFAVLARMQGAFAAHLPNHRAFLSCKTHAATDVLLRGVAEAVGELATLRTKRPDLWAAHFDDRLLDLPLLRVASGRDAALPPSITLLAKYAVRPKGSQKLFDEIASYPFAILGATPGGIYGLVKDGRNNQLFGHPLCDLLILDEASQMSLPEAMMAALPLTPGGRVVVVGDPRQMPPIVQHAWETEPRRTFQEFKSYESLFAALAALDPPFIRFEESFRLHTVMAKFLRDEIYVHDGIEYHSRRTKQLGTVAHADPFVAAVLAPDCPLVVVVHEEAASQARNDYEQALIGPLLRALARPAEHADDASDETPAEAGHALDARSGMGVVVPHRAQRVALQRAFPELRLIDPLSGKVLVEAVDTVERYQGDERDVILVSATESDPEYLAASAGFLLDPRRLTVALSRAKNKMILVASRTIFTHFSADEETFAHAQLWKNLLRRTCTQALWSGERDGVGVEVWGNTTNGAC